jgi:hypothetical protein
MSLISDVKEELGNLDQTPKKLRQFSMLMFVISSVILYNLYPWKIGFWFGLFTAFFVLFLIGIFRPQLVRKVNKLWMGLAFAMGWFVSRFLLSLIYFFIVTPIGLISRAFGKKFIKTGFNKDEHSYWEKRDNPKIDYTKMS